MEAKLKVLFVASGNSRDFDIVPFIKAQGESLKQKGVEVTYFAVNGNGITGYLKNAHNLRNYLKVNQFDIIHAHYTLSGWTSLLSFPSVPVVLSLMGSDAYGEFIDVNKISTESYILVFLTKLIQPFVRAIICKSKHIESYVYLKRKSQVIPNGVKLDDFLPDSQCNRIEIGLKQGKKYVLFLGSKNDIRKNYQLAEAAVNLLKREDVVLLAPYPVTHAEVVKFLNIADCLIVPSLMEGSPNVVKEAMACNCPVIATDVGDVRWLFGDTEGHFITKFSPEDVADKIVNAVEYSTNHGRTNGRNRLIELGLDAGTIALKIIELYQSVAINNANHKRFRGH